MLGYGFCKAYRYYVKNQRDSFLQPPLDLLGGVFSSKYLCL